MNPSKDNDVIIKKITGIWNVWRNKNKDDPWLTERWVQGLEKKKKEKKKKRKEKPFHFFNKLEFDWFQEIINWYSLGGSWQPLLWLFKS